MSERNLPIIGNNALVRIANIDRIPAKVDTGADASSVWATDIEMSPSHELSFCLLGPSHPLYTGERITTKDYKVQQVRNSTGHVSLRYRVFLPMKLHGRLIRTPFTLMDRSRNRFPVLIGRKTIQNKFLVDVSRYAVERPSTFNNEELNSELHSDPYKFHQKYMSKK